MVIQDMPSLRTQVPDPQSKRPKECQDLVPVAYENATKEFERQLDLLIEQHKSYPSIVAWVRSMTVMPYFS